MIKTCEEFAEKYQITFNLTKTKLLCFNANNNDAPHITMSDQQVAVVTPNKHIANYISSVINDKHIIDNTCDLYQRNILLINQ